MKSILNIMILSVMSLSIVSCTGGVDYKPQSKDEKFAKQDDLLKEAYDESLKDKKNEIGAVLKEMSAQEALRNKKLLTDYKNNINDLKKNIKNDINDLKKNIKNDINDIKNNIKNNSDTFHKRNLRNKNIFNDALKKSAENVKPQPQSETGKNPETSGLKKSQENPLNSFISFISKQKKKRQEKLLKQDKRICREDNGGIDSLVRFLKRESKKIDKEYNEYNEYRENFHKAHLEKRSNLKLELEASPSYVDGVLLKSKREKLESIEKKYGDDSGYHGLIEGLRNAYQKRRVIMLEGHLQTVNDKKEEIEKELSEYKEYVEEFSEDQVERAKILEKRLKMFACYNQGETLKKVKDKYPYEFNLSKEDDLRIYLQNFLYGYCVEAIIASGVADKEKDIRTCNLTK